MASDDLTWQALGDGSVKTQDADSGLGHIVSIDVYNAVFISLIVLTGITVWAAYQEVSIYAHIFIAMGIATVKAAVVTLIFMHLNYESKIVWGIVIYPLFIFALILAGTLGDASVQPDPAPLREAPIAAEALKAKPAHAEKGH